MSQPSDWRWALILGASSGFGAAAARALARDGFAIAGVHLDRRATLPRVRALEEELLGLGVPVRLFNLNAADDSRRAEILDQLDDITVSVLLHSLAFGTVRPLVAPADGAATRRHLEMTLDVMAHSLAYWVRDLVARDHLPRGGRVLAMTSSGSHQSMDDYGPVSAAKAALEAHVRQIARELAPRGVTANAIMAGVTRTPALDAIPRADDLIQKALGKNPHGRLTRPDDVAACVVELVRPGTYWMTGNTIRVDGGEDVCA